MPESIVNQILLFALMVAVTFFFNERLTRQLLQKDFDDVLRERAEAYQGWNAEREKSERLEREAIEAINQTARG